MYEVRNPPTSFSFPSAVLIKKYLISYLVPTVGNYGFRDFTSVRTYDLGIKRRMYTARPTM